VRSDWLSTRSVAFRVCLLTGAWIAITAALFGLGELVVHVPAITAFDRHVTHWAVDHRSPAHDAAMRAITWIGSWVAVAVVACVVLVMRATRRLTTAALLLVAMAWAGEVVMVNLVKTAVGRPRPPKALWLVDAHGASFPSGHAANATLVLVVVSAIVLLSSRRPWARITVVTLAALAVVGVGCSRVELGVHWTTDVLAAWLATLTWLAAVGFLFGISTPLAAPGVGPVDPGPQGSTV
jgi:undecaprenyl-diphosphatase